MKTLGFTLLEVVISIALTSTMMVLVWSLFSTYTKLEERSRHTATEIQLVRSLSRQLRSDLDHFATLAVQPNIVSQDQATAKAGRSGEDAQVDSDNPINATDGDGEPDLQSSAGELIGQDVSFESTTVFNSRLPEQTYLRGSATKLELVTRLPATLDVPTGQQPLGAETRYGTYQLVVYEFRDAHDLKSLLTSDPVLNPSLFKPLPTQAPVDPNQPAPPPPAAQPLNPNDSVGLRREVKSWLQVARDRRRDAIFKQAEAAGALVNQPMPPTEPARDLLSELQNKTNQAPQSAGALDVATQAPWMPPPELKPKRDDLPEVTRLQFRYFDGSSWLLDWSGEDGRLPHAVEIAFDLDADAPAVRAKEFAEAHQSVLDGAAIEEVLPREDVEIASFEDAGDPLALLNLDDPTAIVSEYRFVIALAYGGTAVDDAKETSTDGEIAP